MTRQKLAILAAWYCFFPAAAFAQGTRADYERANSLRQQRTENTVFKARVTPHWEADGHYFWYRNDQAGGVREFVRVDLVKGSREAAFDHKKLAEALAKATRMEVQADRLAIDNLVFDSANRSFRFTLASKRWECALPSCELRELGKDDSKPQSLPVLDTPRRTRRTGAQTDLTLVNKTKGVVEIFWLDEEGTPRSYGKVNPGQEAKQHSYAGHVWLVRDAAGKRLAVFEVADEACVAIIDDTLKPREPGGSARRARPAAESPDGKWLARVQGNNLHLRPQQGGEDVTLTTEGKADDGYISEFYWSPDSRRLVALRRKNVEARKVYLIESSPRDQLQPKLHSYTYAKPGDPLPVSKPHLFDVAAHKEMAIRDELFPNPWEIRDLRWEKDSKRFTFVYNQRGHQVLRLVGVDAESGAAVPLVEELSKTFIDYAHKYYANYLDESGELIWMSERDGWNHLYLYDLKTGTLKNQITRGDWVVRGVDRVDTLKRQVWFRAGGIHPDQDPYFIHFCRINFDGSGLVVLTEGSGTHTVTYSPDGRFLIDNYSRVDQPPLTEVRQAADGKRVCELEQADVSALQCIGWKMPEPFVAKGRDGMTDIFGVIFRPSNFDANKKYPVIEQIYAGPQGAFVPKVFRPYYGPERMAELGFIVVQIDGMGTSNRSKAFHDVCAKNLGDAGFPDRILWLKAAAKKYPYMDLSRVGIYGGSAGGQNALGGLLNHGDFYKAAVADCGCHDNRMDKVWWNELWMGWPVGPHYQEQSNVTNAHKLQGKLLLIVGELDRNVDPASTMQVVNALVKANKDFDLLVMPGTGHRASENPYGVRRRQDFFVRHLLEVEPRRE
jgi:dipeptidyl aminopeptidase/acylaminoacyl peptidase